MDSSDTNKQSIRQLLQTIEGVEAVERLHHTDRSNQWLLVVQKDKIQNLTAYMQHNLGLLYKSRVTAVPKLITYNIDTGETAYRLLLKETNYGKIGTYAEVLTKRFPTVPAQGNRPTRPTQEQHEKHNKSDQSERAFHSNRRSSQNTDQRATKKVQHTRISHSNTTQHLLSNTEERGNIIRRHMETDTDTHHMTQSIADERDFPPLETTNDKMETNQTIDNLEQTLTKKLFQIEKTNTEWMQKMEQQMEERLDSILDTKLLTMSQVVADAVTKKLMKVIKEKIGGSENKHSVLENKNNHRITQDSPMKGDQDTPDSNVTKDRKTIEIQKDRTIDTSNTIQQGQPPSTKNDSPHDYLPHESMHSAR